MIERVKLYYYSRISSKRKLYVGFTDSSEAR
jgi:hypothetical protein